MSRSFVFGLVSVLALLCVLPSLPAFSQAPPPSPTAEVQVLLDQAEVARDQYHNKEAIALYQQAREKAISLKDRPGEALALNETGYLYFATGQPAKALEFFQQALPLIRSVGDKRGEAGTLSNIGAVYSDTDRPEKALEFFQQAVTLTETIRTELGGLSTTKTAFLTSNQGDYHSYLSLLLRLHRTDEAFAFAQKTKARSLLDLLSAGKVDLTSSMTEQERQDLNALRQKADTLNAAMVKEGVLNESGSKQRFEQAQAQLTQTQSDLQTLQDMLYVRHPDLSRKRIAKTATVSDLLPLLPEDTALLEYATEQFRERDPQGKSYNKQRLMVFVVTRQNGKLTVLSHPIAEDYDPLADRAAISRIACSDPRIPFRVPARDLYRLLIAPVEKEISGKKRLIICPDGPLWDVPFQALLASEPPARSDPGRRQSWEFLSDRFEIAYAYSATGALTAYQQRHDPKRIQPAETLLALANPAFLDERRFGITVSKAK